MAFSRLTEIDYSTPATKRRKPDGGTSDSTVSLLKAKSIPDDPSQTQKIKFYGRLAECGRLVILSLVPEYCDSYFKKKHIPSAVAQKLPRMLASLLDPSPVISGLDELQVKANALFSSIVVTEEEAENASRLTQQQSGTHLWYQLRAGRATASRLRNAIVTSSEKPSKSLLQAICYPDSVCFSNRKPPIGDVSMRRLPL